MVVLVFCHLSFLPSLMLCAWFGKITRPGDSVASEYPSVFSPWWEGQEDGPGGQYLGLCHVFPPLLSP